jgi:hypothetical protein
MTKRELALAQFLHGAREQADRLADTLDPGRVCLSAGSARAFGRMPYELRSTVLDLDKISRAAGRAFLTLTGKHGTDVEIRELSTLTPAEWTKTAPGLSGKKTQARILTTRPAAV